MVVVERNDNGSATTVLIAVVIIVIIGLAFYFGFYRSHVAGTSTPNSVNVNLTGGTGSGSTGGTGY
ncbi:MAG: hypothetical protein JWN50_36 [Parcubacteria group bacterium]|nr:hypothetical protein [Parcubacteria group bacterium]